MELDDLKAKWQKNITEHPPINMKDMEQIQIILNGKTTDLIASMKKKYQKIISSMLISMLLMVLLLPILTDGFTYPGSVNGFAKTMFFYLVLIIFYWEKLKIINNLELSDYIKERIQQLLKMLKRNRRIEVTFVILLFTGFILIGRFFYGKGLEGIFKPDILIAFPLSIFSMGIIIYFILKSYRKQIKELQEYLAEYDLSDR